MIIIIILIVLLLVFGGQAGYRVSVLKQPFMYAATSVDFRNLSEMCADPEQEPDNTIIGKEMGFVEGATSYEFDEDGASSFGLFQCKPLGCSGGINPAVSEDGTWTCPAPDLGPNCNAGDLKVAASAAYANTERFKYSQAENMCVPSSCVTGFSLGDDGSCQWSGGIADSGGGSTDSGGGSTDSGGGSTDSGGGSTDSGGGSTDSGAPPLTLDLYAKIDLGEWAEVRNILDNQTISSSNYSLLDYKGRINRLHMGGNSLPIPSTDEAAIIKNRLALGESTNGQWYGDALGLVKFSDCAALCDAESKCRGFVYADGTDTTEVPASGLMNVPAINGVGGGKIRRGNCYLKAGTNSDFATKLSFGLAPGHKSYGKKDHESGQVSFGGSTVNACTADVMSHTNYPNTSTVAADWTYNSSVGVDACVPTSSACLNGYELVGDQCSSKSGTLITGETCADSAQCNNGTCLEVNAPVSALSGHNISLKKCFPTLAACRTSARNSNYIADSACYADIGVESQDVICFLTGDNGQRRSVVRNGNGNFKVEADGHQFIIADEFGDEHKINKLEWMERGRIEKWAITFTFMNPDKNDNNPFKEDNGRLFYFTYYSDEPNVTKIDTNSLTHRGLQYLLKSSAGALYKIAFFRPYAANNKHPEDYPYNVVWMDGGNNGIDFRERAQIYPKGTKERNNEVNDKEDTQEARDLNEPGYEGRVHDQTVYLKPDRWMRVYTASHPGGNSFDTTGREFAVKNILTSKRPVILTHTTTYTTGQLEVDQLTNDDQWIPRPNGGVDFLNDELDAYHFM